MESRTRSRKRWWVLSWAGLTLAGVVIHAMAWVPPDRLDAGLSGVAEGTAVKSASNIVDVGVGPVWIALALAAGDWGVYSTVQSIAANGLAAAMALVVLRRVLGIRKKLDAKLARGEGVVDVARRRFLVESPLAVGAIAVAGPAALGACIEPFDLKVRRNRIAIKGLPAGMNGYRAVFVSDTHLGPRIPAAFIERVVRESIALRPDVILLGGDYVHAGSRYIRPAVELFRPFVESGIPTIGVLGNHDWYNSGGMIGALLRDLGIRMVDNSRVFIDGTTRRVGDQASESCLCIAGVGDLMMDRVELGEALAGVGVGVPRLVLSHNPDVAETVGGERVDLMLCGHTHGGQVRLPMIGAAYVPCKFGKKYLGGLVEGPACPVLISRGIGMSICPVRIGVPPEIVEIELVGGE
jgi:uncharacterized protein